MRELPSHLKQHQPPPVPSPPPFALNSNSTNVDSLTGGGGGDATTRLFYENSTAKRINTDNLLADSLRKQYPQLQLTVVPVQQFRTQCDLLGYAANGFATVTPLAEEDGSDGSHSWKMFVPPSRRMDGGTGVVFDNLIFGRFLYKWEGHEFLLYIVNGRDGMEPWPQVDVQYVLGPSTHVVDALVKAVGIFAVALHDEIWVFDSGYWQKSRELYRSIEKARWEDVILDESMKKGIQQDVMRFFGARERYEKLRVPWRRGVIYYGPPGNGKTISIKATMNSLYRLKEPIPTLYVKSLQSFGGPEYSVSQIFYRARATAPCYLVFEDLDSLVSDQVRSYFLNEVDGLANNDGIFMVGSTNHLERLDPGISKRPSRFDRKYEFPRPNLAQRTKYCEYWRHKLSDNKDLEFPISLCKAIAEITDEFSFAFMQEGFVASLLAIAARDEEDEKGEEEDDNEVEVVEASHAEEDGGKGNEEYKDLILWKEMQRQVKILREEM